MEVTSGLTRDEILAKIAARKKETTVPVPIPEWGGTVHVRRLTLGQLKEGGFLDAGGGDTAIALLVACIANENGEPLFTAKDARALMEAEAGAGMRLFIEAAKLNGLSTPELEKGAAIFTGAQESGTASE